MNYIGSKHTLLPFIHETMNAALKKHNDTFDDSKIIADIFAGTGAVSNYFRNLGCRVIANDLQYYSYVLLRATLTTPQAADYSQILEQLTGLEPVSGFVTNNYSPSGNEQRQYFTTANASQCDAIRQAIENTLDHDSPEYFYAIACLLEAIDKVANTASVYGAFLKQFKASALKSMELKPLSVPQGPIGQVFNTDAADIVQRISGDILYLDPPYNERQYSSNYHVLETIARGDNPQLHGVTGMRDNSVQKSNWCSKKTVKESLEQILKNAQFKYIFLSYNNEGLLSTDDIRALMTKYGEYEVYTKEYKRYKADSKREGQGRTTTEYLHVCVKE